jgi:hypothetical protein
VNRSRVLRSHEMREILHTNHYVVTLDEEARVLRRVRSSEQFVSTAHIEAVYDELVRVLRGIDRGHYTQLVDARVAPPRNDPQFEATVKRHHEALYSGFLANAVLVQSAVGKLQVKRMLDASGVKASVFADEAEALEYLAGAVRQSRKP